MPATLRRYLLNRYTAFVLFLSAYTAGLGFVGGLSSLVFHLLVETPLVLYLYYSFNTLLKAGRWTPYVAALPIVLAYGAYDAFFVAYGEVFRIVYFHDLPKLVDVLPLSYRLVLSTIFGLPLLLFVCLFDYRKYRQILACSLPALVVAANVELAPGPFASGFEKVGGWIYDWSDAASVKSNGRFAMLLYYEAKRNLAFAESSRYRNRGQYEQNARAAADYLRRNGNRRNIHLVVLESFVDPTLFRGVTYSQSPRHPAYAALFGDEMGFSLAPVFGGGTAQSEFEALCGVPALRKLSSIEFNAFSGAAAYCLPDVLSRTGYRTIASNGFKPEFFNAIKAYKGAGFSETYFPAEYAKQRPTYISAGEVPEKEEYLFDGTLFDQNLRFVAESVHEHPDRPIFNYVLSIYGHFPHYLDPERRPSVLSMQSDYDDEQLLRVANQHYYRTEAIARYVRALIDLDPSSLIILVSDHLPSLDGGTESYRMLRYLGNIDDSTLLNRILIVESGKPVRYRTLHHYDIPSLIYNYLTEGKYCAQAECNLFRVTRSRPDYDERYMRLMAHAADIDN